MAAITLAEAVQHLSESLAAESAALKAQSYGVGGRVLTRASLSEIRETIKFWRGEVTRLERESQTGGIRHRGGVAL